MFCCCSAFCFSRADTDSQLCDQTVSQLQAMSSACLFSTRGTMLMCFFPNTEEEGGLETLTCTHTLMYLYTPHVLQCCTFSAHSLPDFKVHLISYKVIILFYICGYSFGVTGLTQLYFSCTLLTFNSFYLGAVQSYATRGKRYVLYILTAPITFYYS